MGPVDFPHTETSYSKLGSIGMQLGPPANLDQPRIRGPVNGKTFDNGKSALIYGACGKFDALSSTFF